MILQKKTGLIRTENVDEKYFVELLTNVNGSTFSNKGAIALYNYLKSMLDMLGTIVIDEIYLNKTYKEIKKNNVDSNYEGTLINIPDSNNVIVSNSTM